MKSLLPGLLGLLLLLPPAPAEACGDPIYSRIFVHTHHPDRPFENFAAGRLGVLRETYRTAYLAYAWRAMMGIPTTADEQRHLVESWARREGDFIRPGADDAQKRWLAARAEVAPALPPATPVAVGEQRYSQYTRIQDDAFLRAADTARALAAEWKAHPALVEEWVRHQDAVFGPSAPLPEPDPKRDEGLTPAHKARRRAERDYQAAAAHFYCGAYEDAARAFQRIADSDDTPYQALGAYLVARTHVRQALLSGKSSSYLHDTSTEPDFLARLTEADKVLDQVLATPKLGAMHGPARRLQSLVRFRLRPTDWACELLERVLQKGTGASLATELGDLDLLVTGDTKQCPRLSAPAAELSEWLRVTRGGYQPGKTDEQVRQEGYDTAVARWKATQHVPWLVTALLKARPDSEGLPALLAATAGVPPTSPAGVTLAYRSAHLLRERGDAKAARARLATVPPELTREQVSTDNLLREERFALVGSWEEVFRNAPRRLAGMENGESYSDAIPQPPDTRPVDFGEGVVPLLEPRLTARRMSELAASPGVSPELRRVLSWTAFARAVVVGDDETLKAMATALAATEPAAKGELKAIVAKPSPEERRFEAQLLMMGLPAVSARMESGEDRLASTDPKLDLASDMEGARNWWCGPRPGQPLEPYAFASEAEQRAAAAEWKALIEAGNSVSYFARVALDWAKAHPEDPRSPKALYRVVRASRRGCDQGSAEAKEAFRYLHERYKKTEWAKKAKRVY